MSFAQNFTLKITFIFFFFLLPYLVIITNYTQEKKCTATKSVTLQKEKSRPNGRQWLSCLTASGESLQHEEKKDKSNFK